MRTSRRASRAAVVVATVLALSATVPSSTAAPVRPQPRSADGACTPDNHSVPSVMSRLRRADDHPDFTLRQLRRIDRRLDRALERRRGTGSSSSGRFGVVLRIPVHAHVIDGNRSRGLSRRAVRNQIAVLNKAYGGGQSRQNAASRFEFYLDSFDRTRNQRWHTAAQFDEADRQLRRRLHQGGPDALNLYFSAPRSPVPDSVVLGWATMPWMAHRRPLLDGVTVHQGSVPGGGLRHYNRGDTAVHEVGHWLGLFHTFEGACSVRNDRVEDTAAEAFPSEGCNEQKDTCAADGKDPVHNFMNYSLDTCMNMFTPGQVARMTDNWLAYRTP